jgi:very-short-patch-repair endonuclease
MLFDNDELIIGFVIAVLAFIFMTVKSGGKVFAKYESLKYLNTKAEQNFVNQFLRVLPEQYMLSCKVRLGDITQPINRKDIAAFNSVSRKHIDFVITERSTSKIVACIELDDHSHNRISARKRDNVKNRALKESDINLIRVKNSRTYSNELLDNIVNQLSNNGDEINNEPMPSSIGYTEKTKCSKCNANMVRVDMKFPNKGNHFYKCTNNKCSFRTEPEKSA